MFHGSNCCQLPTNYLGNILPGKLVIIDGPVFSILKNNFKRNHIKLIVFIGSIVLPIAGPLMYLFNKEKWKQK
jgi:hypothetical protein